MKKIYVLTLLLCMSFAFGQSRVVSKKIQELSVKSTTFTNYQLFTKNNDVQKSAKFLTSATDATVLEISSTELNRIVDEAPNYISLAVPYQSELIEVQLYKENILTEGFIAKDEKGNIIDYTPGQYYRGAVAGDATSIVAISFFDDNVMGVISTMSKGNVVLGKSMDKQDYVTYSDKNLIGENPFVCGIDGLEFNKQLENQISFDPDAQNAPNTTNCIKIYYEIANKPYLLNGSDVDATIDWITGIQNNIGTLYSNDDINVALHAVKIWTEDDPYDGTFSENLSEFRETVTEFSGDLAHLVNYPTTTSVAYLNSICTDYRYAYSGISMSYAEVPTYSWTIMAMTHEMGHSLGSPHTHACAWNGNNTAIDGCGPAGGANEGCSGPIPSEGGTIMSYCHLTSAGINFTLGFGPQPGALIRSTVDSKPCLSTECSCMYTINDVEVAYLAGGDIQIAIDDDTSTQWKYKVYPYGTTPPTTWEAAPSANFTLSGLTQNQYFELVVMNLCDGDLEGGQKETLILTGDFCDGTLFTDTGGESGSYSSNQHYVKTFYPSTTGEKVQLSFSRIGLQTNSDYMYIYDGDSVNSPLFEDGTINGNNNPGPSFTSTDSTGAITIEFISNESGNSYGWEATVDCSALGIEDMSDAYGITVYPNPTSDVLNIVSQRVQVESISLTDATGRSVLSSKINSNDEELNIGHLPKGIYILTIKVDGKEITKKIIKK